MILGEENAIFTAVPWNCDIVKKNLQKIEFLEKLKKKKNRTFFCNQNPNSKTKSENFENHENRFSGSQKPF